MSNASDHTPNTKPPIKRARPVHSCVSCRRRKLKCDRQSPCEQCVKGGRGDGCQYDQTIGSLSTKRANGVLHGHDHHQGEGKRFRASDAPTYDSDGPYSGGRNVRAYASSEDVESGATHRPQETIQDPPSVRDLRCRLAELETLVKGPQDSNIPASKRDHASTGALSELSGFVDVTGTKSRYHPQCSTSYVMGWVRTLPRPRNPVLASFNDTDRSRIEISGSQVIHAIRAPRQ